jgi:hypothetical protein
VTVDRWQDCAEYVKHVETGMLRADRIRDDTEPLIIKLGENSSFSDDLADGNQSTNGKDNNHYIHRDHSASSLT